MRKCLHCGAELVRTGTQGPPQLKWCSQKCRRDARRDRERPAILAALGERRCPVCGILLPEDKKIGTECCSQKCRLALNARKRSEARAEKARAKTQACASCEAVIAADPTRRRKYCSPECKSRALSVRWREKSPGYMRKYNYGLSDGQYKVLLASQGGVCAICGTSEWGGKTGAPHVDHDHACNHPDKGVLSCAACVRGILCATCNNGIGVIGEDPARLRAAADYLERYSHGTLFSVAG